MALEIKLSYTAAVILKGIAAGHQYGFEIMESIGLPSGTVYPALRRLESSGALSSQWEHTRATQRPPRKYYSLTPDGEELLNNAEQRYRLPELTSIERE